MAEEKSLHSLVTHKADIERLSSQRVQTEGAGSKPKITGFVVL